MMTKVHLDSAFYNVKYIISKYELKSDKLTLIHLPKVKSLDLIELVKRYFIFNFTFFDDTFIYKIVEDKVFNYNLNNTNKGFEIEFKKINKFDEIEVPLLFNDNWECFDNNNKILNTIEGKFYSLLIVETKNLKKITCLFKYL